MPTGYTYKIIDGEMTTFQEFAKQCIRAFGSCMHLREEPTDSEYRPMVPSEYYLKELNSSKEKLIELSNQTNEELVKIVCENLLADKERIIKHVEKVKKDLNNLNKILEGAENFVPPTPEHIKFKEFMIEQLTSTIKWDCTTEYYEKSLLNIEEELLNLDGEEIRKERIKDLNKDILYYEDSYNKEVKSCEKHNQWVSDIFESLNNK